MMSSNEIIKINTIEEFTERAGFPPSNHPLIAINRMTDIIRPISLDKSVQLNLYSISMKDGSQCTLRYGWHRYDFKRGVLNFFAPGQVKSWKKTEDEEAVEVGCWAPTPHNMQNYEILVVDEEKLLEVIGNIQLAIPKANIEENNLYISASEEELQRKKTGIVNRMPASITEQSTNSRTEFMSAFLKKSLMASSALMIIMYDPNKRAPGSEGDLLGKIGIGCVMENMWLMAHSLGIGMQVIAAVGYLDSFEKHIKDVLGIPEYFKLAYSCRLGYPVSTGGSTGIGLALAVRFLTFGNEVIICGRSEDKLNAAKERFPKLHIKRCDVGNEKERTELAEWVLAEFPDFNVLVNNAGIQQRINFNESGFDWHQIKQEIAINLEAPIHFSKMFITHLLAKNNSCIINVSSGLAFLPPVMNWNKVLCNSENRCLNDNEGYVQAYKKIV